MDESKISFAWGGCGNLINHCLKSNQHYELIQRYYSNINDRNTWTTQEWSIRYKIGQIEHVSETSRINLVWNNSLDTSFHYIIKNIVINHLEGPILKRVEGVIKFNKQLEDSIKQSDHVVLDEILHSSEHLYQWCSTIDAHLSKDKIQSIFDMWKDKTKMFYEKNSLTVLGYFKDLGIDYSPTTLYNILYENSNT